MEVAHAASGRAGGFLALDWCDGQETGPLARRSFLLHKELDTELGGCGYRAMRTLSLEVQPQRNGRKEAVAPDWVDGQTKHTRTIGTTETTAQVHPRLLTKSLMARAEKLGARLVQAEVVVWSGLVWSCLCYRVPGGQGLGLQSLWGSRGKPSGSQGVQGWAYRVPKGQGEGLRCPLGSTGKFNGVLR